ncbi:MAG: fructose-1,6-bisphosphatase [Anaerofustis stercorihominis]|nr:fructose-1,6-bisphosphatase [Anaerofustis stercorihominis]
MKTFDKQTLSANKEYLELLGNKFRNIPAATAEIINLNAILNLPKGTEHFISDIHGEYGAFEHILRNCSGSIRRKVTETLKDKLDEDQLNEMITVIYYPQQKIKLLKEQNIIDDSWYERTIKNLIEVCKVASSKYSHSKIRKSFPENYSYIIQELMFKSDINGDRENYYNQIIRSMIDTDACEDFIIKISETIRKLCLDHLHIVGDIYDRGYAPHMVMDTLMNYHTIDIQWGNHDILWIGAAAGNAACIANAVRICMRYGNTGILEDAYGINIIPLTMFAMNTYPDTDLELFMPKISDEIPDLDDIILAKMQKAISIIQFKLENEVIDRNPEYGMEDRKLIDKVNYENYTLNIDGTEYKLNTESFPTIDPDDPAKLTEEEEKVINSLVSSFTSSEKLRSHIEFMLNTGGIYLLCNKNLLLHACVPMNDDYSFTEVVLEGEKYKGKALLDKVDEMARKAYYSSNENTDIFWYLWCAPTSPLFGKDKMATYERYFINDKATHKERYTPFYKHLDDRAMAVIIMNEFGLNANESHIICGHVPVKIIKGENPVKAEGKIICIDGGFAKAYQKETGIAGCTLTYNSYGMNLIMHEPFNSIEESVTHGLDIKSESRFVDSSEKRLLVSDTDTGEKLKKQIYYLEMLLYAYRSGELAPKK